MNDRNTIIIIVLTIFVVFGLIFSVKSPERKIIESPILWKEEYQNSIFNTQPNNKLKVDKYVM